MNLDTLFGSVPIETFKIHTEESFLMSALHTCSSLLMYQIKI